MIKYTLTKESDNAIQPVIITLTLSDEDIEKISNVNQYAMLAMFDSLKDIEDENEYSKSIEDADAEEI